MNQPLDFSALAKAVWQDFFRARRGLIIYDFLFKLVAAWLLVPLVGVLLAALLSWAGHIAVSNHEIIDFLLTPIGLLYGGLLATLVVALQFFEQAGVMVLVTLTGSGERPGFKRALGATSRKSLRVAWLGVIMTALFALTLLPFVLLGAWTYNHFLSDHDIYFYLNVRPPAFWIAAGIGAFLLLVATGLAVWLFVRWALALPILLFEDQSAWSAMRASRERVRGAAWRVVLVLLGWLVGVLVLGMALELGFRLLAGAILANFGERPVVPILLLLVTQGALLATWSFIFVAGLGLITRQLYLFRSAGREDFQPVEWKAAPGLEKPASPMNWWLVWLSMPLLALAPIALWFQMSYYLADREPVFVTAHRGHARAAPENTLSAIRKAIDSGADYVEVDVQMTADGKIVLLHDRDLKRVAGVSRRLDEFTFDELRKLDVGSWFDPAFADERVPTLEEAIALCRGRIRMNIELKFFGPDLQLAQAAAQLLREQAFEAECIVTCFAYDALQQVRQHNPKLRTGMIVAQALGDVSRLEVDALSVRADFLSDQLLNAAHREGMEVHVWTVNDPGQMTRLIKRGVDNILTSDPDVAIRVRDEWTGMTGTERLVLASRLLLGLES